MELEDKLLELCADILAHDWMGWEITLCGNGYNSFECSGVAFKLLEILNVKVEDENFQQLLSEKLVQIHREIGE